jgi:hypothetical protein
MHQMKGVYEASTAGAAVVATTVSAIATVTAVTVIITGSA